MRFSEQGALLSVMHSIVPSQKLLLIVVQGRRVGGGCNVSSAECAASRRHLQLQIDDLLFGTSFPVEGCGCHLRMAGAPLPHCTGMRQRPIAIYCSIFCYGVGPLLPRS